MPDQQLIVGVERLRDDLGELRIALRRKYPGASRQVVSADLKARAAGLGEAWLVRFSQSAEIAAAVQSGMLADLNVHFQRLLSLSEHASIRARYDDEISAILKQFTIEVVIPMKRLAQPGRAVAPIAGEETAGQALSVPEAFRATCFVGQSFVESDSEVNEKVRHCLESLGWKVVTGERPEAGSISEKVKRLIDGQWLFVGIFTKRDKIAGRAEWTTSSWVIDEKAYAIGKKKKVVLIKEADVDSIGGIQGDYEFLEFRRNDLASLMIKIVEVIAHVRGEVGGP